VLGVTTTRDQGQEYNNVLFTPRDGPCDLNNNPQANRCQNFGTANAASTGATNLSPIPIPPLVKIVKYDYPKFDGLSSNFDIWKSRFIASICATELAPLYDRASASLYHYGHFQEDDEFYKYDIQLYSRLLQALPDSSTFIQSSEYLSRGLALWHALLEDNNSTGGVHNTHILLPALYSLHRDPSESIDSYWNRFYIHVRNIRRDPNAPVLTKEHLRLQFLISLGGDFHFLKLDWENSSLDEKWVLCSDGDLKSSLRLIQQAKLSSTTDTIASSGYNSHSQASSHHANAVHAVKPPTSALTSDRTPADPRIDTLCILAADTAKLLAEHSTILSKCVASLEKTGKPRVTTSKYCWTHGGCNHVSADCRTKATGHQDAATWKNRMGGSERNLRDK